MITEFTTTMFRLFVALLMLLAGGARIADASADARGGAVLEPPASSGAALSEVVGWTSFAVVPPPTFGAPAVLDPVRGRMIVVSGYRWSWDETVWSLGLSSGDSKWSRLETVGEPPFDQHLLRAVYDPIGDRIITMGFRRQGGGKEMRSLSLAGVPTWSLMASSASPAPGYPDGLVYDSRRHRVLAFGGDDIQSLWAFGLGGGTSWSKTLTTGPYPPFSYGFSAVYDSLRDRVLILGGLELWELALGGAPAWRRIDAVPPQSIRVANTAISLDVVADRLIAIIAMDYFYYPTFAWEFSLVDDVWREMTSWNHWPRPDSREGASCVWDPRGRRVILHSGKRYLSGFYYPDTWELRVDGTKEWRELVIAPPQKRGASAVFDPSRGQLLILGGTVYESVSHDYAIEFDRRLWMLRLDPTPQWSPVSEVFERKGAGVALDAQRDMILGVGGFMPRSSGCGPHDALVPDYAGDAWSFDLASNTWGPALPRGEHAEAFTTVLDPWERRLVTLGGYRATLEGCGHTPDIRYVASNHLRMLSLDGGGAWTTIQAEGVPPPPQFGHVVAVDADRRTMVVIGGRTFGSTIYRDQVWELTLTSPPRWRQRVALGTPPPFSWEGDRDAVYDPVRERVLVAVASQPNSLWSLELKAEQLVWKRLEPGGASIAAGHPLTEYDPVADRLLVYREDTGEVAFLKWGDPLTRVDLLSLPGGPTNPAARGLLHFAVLSQSDLDATELDPATVEFTGDGIEAAQESPVPFVRRDVNGDDLPDLVISLRAIEGANASAPHTIRLDGRTYSGKRIRAYGGVGRMRAPGPDPIQAGNGDSDARLNPLVVLPAHAAGKLRVSLRLEDRQAAEIEVFDVLGRRVERQEVRGPQPELSLPAGGRSLPAGLFVLRLRQGSRTSIARATVLR